MADDAAGIQTSEPMMMVRRVEQMHVREDLSGSAQALRGLKSTLQKQEKAGPKAGFFLKMAWASG